MIVFPIWGDDPPELCFLIGFKWIGDEVQLSGWGSKSQIGHLPLRGLTPTSYSLHGLADLPACVWDLFSQTHAGLPHVTFLSVADAFACVSANEHFFCVFK